MNELKLLDLKKNISCITIIRPEARHKCHPNSG